ncbi:MAG: T9SS type A sorting domain-containing protein [Bacteroidales bacterium]|nr:T9SS type A sorting domain-containing protein [Bacteroidales bacterium]
MLDVEEVSITKNIKVYPVPSKDKITVDVNGNDQKPVQLALYDLNGTLIFSHEIYDTYVMDIQSLNIQQGMYVLRVEGENLFEVHKIVYAP